MSDLQPKTDDVQPKTYSQKMIDYFADKEQNVFTIIEIEQLVNAFSKLEYAKRRGKTDEMPFAKYKFKKVTDVAKFDKQYLQWLLKQDMMDKYEELKDEINKHI